MFAPRVARPPRVRRLLASSAAVIFLASLLTSCGISTYPGFTESELTNACTFVHQHGSRITSVAACMSAAQQHGYRTRYTLQQLKLVCPTLVLIQNDLLAKHYTSIQLFDVEISLRLSHWGPGVIFYREPPGSFLPASCSKVLNASLVEADPK